MIRKEKRKQSPSPTREAGSNSMKTGIDSKVEWIPEKRESKWVPLLFLLATGMVVVTILNYLETRSLRQWNESIFTELANAEDEAESEAGKPRVWIEGQRMETGYLTHVIEMFDRLGYKRVNGSEEEWDVLWSHEYPFIPSILGYPLQPHQRVNHFPGSGYITNKVSLATSELKHVPKAFHLPKEKDNFMEFAEKHPDKLWVKKSNAHRGIRIQSTKEVDLNEAGTFMQEFVQNPLLIDGKKFDIGIYVIMTSVEPLRVYDLNSDNLLRFCARPYLPFNSSDLDSYVVGDDYTPIWEIPSLKKYFVDSHLNMKESLSEYLKSIGKEPDILWNKIDAAIASVYSSKASLISKLTAAVGDSRHFFEMVRFDFVVDEDMEVYIMEANMSPNLSSKHFAPNAALYEQVVFNMLSIAGIAQHVHNHEWMDRKASKWNMMVNDKDLSVSRDICSSDKCRKSCGDLHCRVCTFCLSEGLKTSLKDAFLEHKSRWNMRRIFPSHLVKDTKFEIGSDDEVQQRWFEGKCLQDLSWCA